MQISIDEAEEEEEEDTPKKKKLEEGEDVAIGLGIISVIHSHP